MICLSQKESCRSLFLFGSFFAHFLSHHRITNWQHLQLVHDKKFTTILSFMDMDEYLVPTRNNYYNWGPILDEKKDAVFGIRASRAKPRREFMDKTTDPRLCSRPTEDGKKNGDDDKVRVTVHGSRPRTDSKLYDGSRPRSCIRI
jgi:hypothetical protein